MHNDVHVSHTLPANDVYQLVQLTASRIQCSEEDVYEAMSHFIGEDVTDVLEAMEMIDSADVNVLKAYFDSSIVLDECLDDYLEEIA